MNLSARVYGNTCAAIRQYARTHPQFTAAELLPFANSRKILHAILCKMIQRGEIKRIGRSLFRATALARTRNVDDAATVERRRRFEAGLETLLTTRAGEQLTQKEIARVCGVTRQRIDQIEQRALQKLRRFIQENPNLKNELHLHS